MSLAWETLQTIYFLLPAYAANMAPVALRRINPLPRPIDGGKKLGAKPLFGPHKTWGGLLLGVLASAVVYGAQNQVYQYGWLHTLTLFDYPSHWPLAILLGLGALLGDLTKSFFKRRANVAAGKPWIPFDQLDFATGALLAAAAVYVPPTRIIILALLISPLLHIATNHIGYWLRINTNRW